MEKITNDKGYSFEVDVNLNDYAHETHYRFDKPQKGLPLDIVVFKVTFEDKLLGYILYDSEKGDSICDEMSLGDIIQHIDVLRMSNANKN